MRPNNIIAIIIIFLFTINRISGQCNEDALLDYFVIYDEGTPFHPSNNDFTLKLLK